MTEVAHFLRTRYMEMRALAEAAKNDGEGRWSFHQQPYRPGGDPIEYDASVKRALHINANQPDVVIADCDAKLALIDDLLEEGHQTVDDEWYSCPAAVDQQLGFESGRSGPCNCGRDVRVNRRLAILARPFAGHPDHKGEERAP